MVLGVTSGPGLRANSTFIWSGIVSSIGMCLSIILTMLNILPNIKDKIIKRVQKWIVIEVTYHGVIQKDYKTSPSFDIF